ncbi:hypothetical protein, partial [Aeromicrobium sp.]|uniref:hypothetical protein n=1 Tax=Aeromicrobium sp. TaxID=1871063 RepID=UPI003C3CA671
AKDVSLTECPSPPFDACPLIEGDQPEGTVCEDPFDQCDNIEGDQPEGTVCDQDDSKKVVVCKYVSTPGGELDHIIIVSENSLDEGFVGIFPFTFGDAQDSVAIRYATEGEQAKDVLLTECVTPPPFDACPLIEGDQPEGTVCDVPPPPFDQCPRIAGDQPAGTVCDGGIKPDDDDEVVHHVTPAREAALLPDTGGLPLWMLLLAGPLTAAGLLILMRRRPVAFTATLGGIGATHSLSLPPTHRVVTPTTVVTESREFRGSFRTLVAAVGTFLRGGR